MSRSEREGFVSWLQRRRLNDTRLAHTSALCRGSKRRAGREGAANVGVTVDDDDGVDGVDGDNGCAVVNDGACGCLRITTLCLAINLSISSPSPSLPPPSPARPLGPFLLLSLQSSPVLLLLALMLLMLVLVCASLVLLAFLSLPPSFLPVSLHAEGRPVTTRLFAKLCRGSTLRLPRTSNPPPLATLPLPPLPDTPPLTPSALTPPRPLCP